MSFNKKLLQEKILSDDLLYEINLYLEYIYDIENTISMLLSKNLEKENPIYDRNDFENKMLSLDGGYDELGDIDYRQLDNGGYEEYSKKLFEIDLKELVNKYLDGLGKLAFLIDSSLEELKLKTNDFYRLYFKIEVDNVIDSIPTSAKYSDFNGYMKLKQSLELFKNNPYKIILNTYLKYLDRIYSLVGSIKLNEDNLYKQAEIIKNGLPIDIRTFENLKKWEDSIRVKDYISIYDLVKKEK